jgi:hypothetical protein
MIRYAAWWEVSDSDRAASFSADDVAGSFSLAIFT